ncbi:Cysteine desulfurase IscS [bioreactor metagenome]|uniref:cysteine desulfurase n=1 Tax=bioreactor metagenome TaxID=1076179 RepID=A0A645DHH5_9ZZZZ
MGLVHAEDLKAALRPDTILVSIMAANNEVGTVEPIKELAALAHEAGVLFHTDAVQAAGHISVDVKDWNVDLLSLSAHKFHGPRGVGAIYIKKATPILPLIYGGGQEKGRRSGTENVAGAWGLAAALSEAVDSLEAEAARLSALRDKLIDSLLKVPASRLTGHPTQRLPGLASFVFECVEGEGILLKMDAAGICISTGSACSSTSLEPSHVLLGIGLPHEIAHGSVRLSLGADTTEEDVDYIIETLPRVLDELRAMSPLWNN